MKVAELMLCASRLSLTRHLENADLVPVHCGRRSRILRGLSLGFSRSTYGMVLGYGAQSMIKQHYVLPTIGWMNRTASFDDGRRKSKSHPSSA